MPDDDDRIWRERGLLNAVLAGDERAWRTWYDESFQDLYAYVHWRCAGRRDWVDDVVQETWLTAVRRIRSFDPARASFRNWLRGVAANILRNQRRRRNGQAQHTVSLDEDAARIAAPPAQPDHAERTARIAAALGRLPEHYELVLRAKYFDQQSVAQIAAEWQTTAKAIESLLTRAREAFRTEYQRLELSDERDERV